MTASHAVFLAAVTNPSGERGILFTMKTTRQVSAFLLGAALVCAPALGFSQDSTPRQDNTAKQNMKNAGQDTKNAAKDAGQGTKQGTKKAYHKTKSGTKKAWHKTKNTTTGAVNGGKEGAKEPQ
jgi:ribulose kinase